MISTLNGKNSISGVSSSKPWNYYVGFNVNDPIFDGKIRAIMRKAMNLLIDREFIVENVGQTGQIAADSSYRQVCQTVTAEYSRQMIQATTMQPRQAQIR